MARYKDAVCRLCRREGMQLFLKGNRCHGAACAISKRNKPPGMHTWSRAKKDYGKQLREKQKAKRYYGVLDSQFKKYFKEADRLQGDTGENLLLLLEKRLDNVVKRLGFAASAAQARQMIGHGHITVNGKKVKTTSYQIRKGDTIRSAEKEKSQKLIRDAMEGLVAHDLPSWLVRDDVDLSGVVSELPIREEVPIEIREQLIVEFSSR